MRGTGVIGRDRVRETAWWNQEINPYPAISFNCSEVSNQATTPINDPRSNSHVSVWEAITAIAKISKPDPHLVLLFTELPALYES